ncbi:MAG: hypothetical protein WD397_13605 [Wenzhouxiangellaceae bacterium]
MNVKSFVLLVSIVLTFLCGSVLAQSLSVGVACQDAGLGDGVSHEKLYECAASVSGGAPPYTYTWFSEDFSGQFENFGFFSRHCSGQTQVSVGVEVVDSLGSDVHGSGGTVLDCESRFFSCEFEPCPALF